MIEIDDCRKIDDLGFILMPIRQGRLKNEAAIKTFITAYKVFACFKRKDLYSCKYALNHWRWLLYKGFGFYEIYNNFAINIMYIERFEPPSKIEYAYALKRFDTAVRMKPKNLIIRYNRARARHLANRNIEDMQGAYDDFLVVKETLKKAEGLPPWYKKRINKGLQDFPLRRHHN